MRDINGTSTFSILLELNSNNFIYKQMLGVGTIDFY